MRSKVKCSSPLVIGRVAARWTALAAVAMAFILLQYGSTSAASPGAEKQSGLWWAAPPGSESGWAVAVDHQGDKVIAALATYDKTGSAVWFLMPDPTLYVPVPFDDVWPDTTWQGPIYQMTGPSFGKPFDPSQVRAAQVGGGGFHFPRPEDRGIGVLYWSIEGSGVYGPYKDITRYVFADPAPVCVDGGTPSLVANYQGFWWNPTESGWALHLTHQGDVIVALWFTYDTVGKATWLLMPMNRIAESTYSGSIYRPTGPAYSAAAFDPSGVTATAVGSVTLNFIDRDNGSFTYMVTGDTRTETITRLIVADPPTVCNE